jgi:hypothetical protein
VKEWHKRKTDTPPPASKERAVRRGALRIERVRDTQRAEAERLERIAREEDERGGD